MSRSRKVVCTLIAGFFLVSACTTHSYAPGTDTATRELEIKAGDQVRVVTTHRERLSFDVTEVRGDRFIGVTSDVRYPKETLPAGTTVEVLFDDLAVLQVTRSDPRKAAIGVIVTLTAIGAVMSALPAVGLPAAAPAGVAPR